MEMETTRVAVMAAFKAGWVGATAAKFPVEYPNTKFSQPKNSGWARLTLQLGSKNSVAIGRARTRQIGLVILQIFTPEEKGTSDATKAADLFDTIFSAKQIVPEAGLVLEFEEVGANGPFTNGGFSQLNADVVFRVDKTR